MRPALYGAAHAIENLNGADRAQENFTIGGNVCESSDLFAENLSLPELRRGDLIAIKTTGAYGAAMASQYNMHDLPEAVYVRNSENMALGQYKYAV
jgi:diaminopimelate decarboxylase